MDNGEQWLDMKNIDVTVPCNSCKVKWDKDNEKEQGKE